MAKTPTLHYNISFGNTGYPAISLPAGSLLAECLDIENSPVLFGCRTGDCGSCITLIAKGERGELPPPTEKEQEILDLYSDGHPDARLACQIALCCDLVITRGP